MDTAQASAFEFPNSLLGVAGFAAVATTGAVLLVGASLHRWYWLALQEGTPGRIGGSERRPGGSRLCLRILRTA